MIIMTKSSLYIVLLSVLIFTSSQTVYAETISCTPSHVEVNSVEGMDFIVEVYSTAAWTATVNQSWVSVSPTSGAGDAFVNISVPTGEEGTAKVLFSNGGSSAMLTITRKAPSGELSGKFSVSADKKVIFSQGNVQYQLSTNSWRFAEHQYDYVGSDNSSIGSQYYSGWIDLFHWGTGDNPTEHTTSGGAFSYVDWGENKFINGGNKAGIWRTLSIDEWKYLFRQRENAESLWGHGKVNGVKGLIILPDDWLLPSGVSFKASTTRGYTWETNNGGRYYYHSSDPLLQQAPGYNMNSYSLADWEKMETNGAVFLPAAGYRRDGTEVREIGTDGDYWSNSFVSGSLFYEIMFTADMLGLGYYSSKYIGNSVRLVKDVSGAAASLGELSETKGSNKVFRNGQILILRGDKTYTLHGQEVK